jgi:hypothetical protein
MQTSAQSGSTLLLAAGPTNLEGPTGVIATCNKVKKRQSAGTQNFINLNHKHKLLLCGKNMLKEKSERKNPFRVLGK